MTTCVICYVFVKLKNKIKPLQNVREFCNSQLVIHTLLKLSVVTLQPRINQTNEVLGILKDRGKVSYLCVDMSERCFSCGHVLCNWTIMYNVVSLYNDLRRPLKRAHISQGNKAHMRRTPISQFIKQIYEYDYWSYILGNVEHIV